MTVLLLYASVVVLALSVLFRRSINRRVIATQRALGNDEQALHLIDRTLIEAHRHRQMVENRLVEFEGRMEEGRQAVATIQAQLDKARQAPSERYYVFERQERAGAIWEVSIRPDPAVLAQMPGGGRSFPNGGRRVYLVAAPSKREALDRAGLRFSHQAGFLLDCETASRLFQKPPVTAGDLGEATAGPRPSMRPPDRVRTAAETK